MANIVLVHGAWHGAWCYRHTAAALRRMGHEVFTPIVRVLSSLISEKQGRRIQAALATLQ